MTPTRFAGLSPIFAGMIIVVLFTVITFGLLTCKPLDLERKTPKGDLDLYQQIAERVHKGEGYYKVAGEELRTMGYPVTSIFNWRLPFHAWLLGSMPNFSMVRGLLIALALFNLILWLSVFYRNDYSIVMAGFGIFVMAGFILFAAIPNSFLSHEVWAGLLIALSLGAYGRGWTSLSVICGLAALLFRELIIPFACIMLALVLYEKKRGESMAWLSGIIVYGAVLALHWSVVARLTDGNKALATGGWLCMQGWPFVLNTAQINPYFILAPVWIVAIVLPLSLLGLAGWRGGLGLRVFLTVGFYALAFAFIGKPVNIYWGVMYSSIMPLGLLYLPSVIRDLSCSLRSIRRSKDPSCIP